MVEDMVEDLEALREVVMQDFLLFFEESVGIGKSALFRVEWVLADQILALEEVKFEKSEDLGE